MRKIREENEYVDQTQVPLRQKHRCQIQVATHTRDKKNYNIINRKNVNEILLLSIRFPYASSFFIFGHTFKHPSSDLTIH